MAVESDFLPYHGSLRLVSIPSHPCEGWIIERNPGFMR
jgi:hypothetical protein